MPGGAHPTWGLSHGRPTNIRPTYLPWALTSHDWIVVHQPLTDRWGQSQWAPHDSVYSGAGCVRAGVGTTWEGHVVRGRSQSVGGWSVAARRDAWKGRLRGWGRGGRRPNGRAGGGGGWALAWPRWWGQQGEVNLEKSYAERRGCVAPWHHAETRSAAAAPPRARHARARCVAARTRRGELHLASAPAYARAESAGSRGAEAGTDD